MAKKHFFQPLLPDFHNHLTIPVAFFSKYIEGRCERKTTAKLRSDASKNTWEVKIEDGRRLTDGWKEFALAHDLRIGDIVIFRQEKDMAFHVTLMGPSCCEIQYESCVDDENKLDKIPKKKNPKREAESSSCFLDDKNKLDKIPKKKNPKRESESSSPCFVANVSPSSLRDDTMFFPMSFVRANGLDTRRGEIVLMNEKGTSWTFALKREQCGRRIYIRRGWRSFCSANGLKAGDLFTFKLIKRGGTLVLLKATESEEEECSEADEIVSLSTDSDSSEEESNQDEKCFKKKPRSSWRASPSPYRNRFVTLAHSSYNFERSFLFLPVPFTRIHGITVETKMSLLDKHGVKWLTQLSSEGRRIKIRRGWKEFFNANSVKTGESVTLKLIWEGDTSCVLKFCSKVKPYNQV